jgi:predicted O-methyltransferase YrrM
MALEATDLQSWADAQVDMAPHYRTLTRYAREAQTIVEFGVRGGVSTWALLDGLPTDGVLWSVDIVDCVVPLRVSSDPRWHFIHGDDMDPDVQKRLPRSADLVFIDTSHEYEHTRDEIIFALVLDPARIVFHDYVMEPVRRAVDKFLARDGWHLVDNELPFGLVTVEPNA